MCSGRLIPPLTRVPLGGPLMTFGSPVWARTIWSRPSRPTPAIISVRAVEDCSVEQWRALVLLSDRRVHTMAEVAICAVVPAPSLPRLVDRLVMDGVVHRTADPADRRRVLVQITARGRTLHRTLAARVENACADVIDVGDVAEAEDLLRLLSAIFDARKAQHHRW